MLTPDDFDEVFDQMHAALSSGVCEAALAIAPTPTERLIGITRLHQAAARRGVQVIFTCPYPKVFAMVLKENAELPTQQFDTVCKDFSNAKR